MLRKFYKIIEVTGALKTVVSCHYVIDWNYDEDRSRIRKGYGPENMSRIRRFAIGLIKKKPGSSVAQKMRRMNKNIRAVFDYLKMTRNICSASALDG